MDGDAVTDTVKREDVLALVEENASRLRELQRDAASAGDEEVADMHEQCAESVEYVARQLRALPPAGDGEVERLREALTPSAATKAEYMGEFSVPLPDRDEDGNEVMRQINVPWTTIKEIMAAIRARATLTQGEEK